MRSEILKTAAVLGCYFCGQTNQTRGVTHWVVYYFTPRFLSEKDLNIRMHYYSAAVKHKQITFTAYFTLRISSEDFQMGLYLNKRLS